MEIILSASYQTIDNRWHVPWWTDDGLQRNERVYIGDLPDDATIITDVQGYLDTLAQQQQDEADAEAQAASDAQQALLDGLSYYVTDADGNIIDGAQVTVADADGNALACAASATLKDGMSLPVIAEPPIKGGGIATPAPAVGKVG